MQTKIEQPYGLWKSPISVDMVSRKVGLDATQYDTDGRTLVWLERRGDRNVLVARSQGEGQRDLTDTLNVRGGVGYGGGEFSVHQGTVYFAERSGRLYRQPLRGGGARPILPGFGAAASPSVSPDGRWVVYVFSDGREDALGLVDAEGQDWPVKLVRGSDFYRNPAWHPRGEWLAWVEWDHPNMPWDGTRLMLARMEGSPPRPVEARQVGGGERIPAQQPRFSPDGRWLSFVEGGGEWENLVVMNLASGEKRTLVEGDGFTLASPAWGQGGQDYAWSGTSQRLFGLRIRGGFTTLWRVELDGTERQIDTGPYTDLSALDVSPVADEVVFAASAPDVPLRLVRWDGSQLVVDAYLTTESVPQEMLPGVRELTWSAPDGTAVHGLYYAPRNPRYTSSGLPPAFVQIHGGPTSAAGSNYAPGVAYFTSRGYGFLDVNYRGSTGYGRSYQDKLLGAWGLVDVEDAAGAARALASQGLADPKRLVIIGGSAGGYTVYNALIRHPGLFKAGVSLYGVSNLFTLAVDTHKFEERYTISLVGELPHMAERYREWSPVFHADKIQDPVAIFQGEDDRVVVPSQSESIANALRGRGIPHVYRLYPGEGHGFRKSETLADYLKTLEQFLLEYVLF